MKQISILIVGFAAALAVAPALAEDFTAGKTPAQLFRSDCATCHHSPNGLVKQRTDVDDLTAFLREHYTTKPDMAAALAVYVSGFAPSRGAGRDRPRHRSEDDAPATTADAPAGVKSPDAPPARRRRVSGQGVTGKRRARDDGDAPRSPRVIPTAAHPPEPDAKPAAAPASADAQPHEGNSQPHEADDPTSRLRSYLSSGLGSEDASAQAARPGAPKVRKRPAGAADAQPAGDQAPLNAPHAAQPPAAQAASGTPETAPLAETPPPVETAHPAAHPAETTHPAETVPETSQPGPGLTQ